MIRYPITWGHNNLVLNGHLNSDGTVNEALVKSTFIVDNFQENPAFRDLRDPYHLTQGGQLGRAHKGMRVLQLSGRIEAPDASQDASLSDDVRLLRAAFDPAICYRDSPSTDGAYLLQFQEATADTVTFPTGRISMVYVGRPVQQPFVDERLDDRGARAFRVALVCADPRAYRDTVVASTIGPGSGSIAIGNHGTTAGPLKVTITMDGAGSAAYTITRSGVTFGLDLSGMVLNDVVVVVMETNAVSGRGRYITKNGVENATLKNTAASTWLDVPTGTTTFTVANGTNVRSTVLETIDAWA